jgi:hypothetical protein
VAPPPFAEGRRSPEASPADSTATTPGDVGSREAPVDRRPPTTRQSVPPAELADRFLDELARHPTPSNPEPLPSRFRPMADTILGHHRVLISVDEASRQALRSVGKVAATTENVIHLDTPPSSAAAAVVAHELTHVAHPSPAPRFFDDDRHSPEERRAEQVAAVMARAPLAPTRALAQPSTAPSSAAPMVRRTPATAAPSAHAPTVTAAELAARASGASAPGTQRSSSPVIRRELATGTGSSSSSSTSSTSPSPNDDGGSAVEDGRSDGMSDEAFRRALDRHLDYLVRRLSQQITADLGRRGGRFWRGV